MAGAHAATVGRDQPDDVHYDPPPLVLRSAPGEALDAQITQTYDGLLAFSDRAGAAITPGVGCTRGDVATTCEREYTVYAYLSDRDDQLHATATYGWFSVDGGAGADTLQVPQGWLRGGPGPDRLSATGPWVTADYSDHAAPLTLRLADGVATDGNGAAGEGDVLDDSIENLRGGSGSDVIEGDSKPNDLDGGDGGDDDIRGGAGDDNITAWEGRTQVDGGAGWDTIRPGGVAAAVHGGPGEDRVDLGLAPTMSQLVTLDGVANDGPMAPGSRADWYPGVVEVADLLAWVPVRGQIDSDVEDVTGGWDNDVLIGNAGANDLDGYHGDDVLVGGPGADVLNGGDGNDTIWARDDSADTVSCGADRDRVIVDALDTVVDCEQVYTGTALPPAPPRLAPPTRVLPPPDPRWGWYGPNTVWYVPPPSFSGPPLPSGVAPTRVAPGPPLFRKPIVLRASRVRVRRGRTVTIRGVTRPSVYVELDSDPGLRGFFKRIKRTRADTAGQFAFRRVRVRKTTNFLVRVGVQASPTVKVAVRR